MSKREVTTEEDSRSVMERLRHCAGTLTPGERKIARALMADYPTAGLRTSAELARRAGVSAPTVVRFAVQLGFPGYRELQDAIRSELSARKASPLTLDSTVTPPDFLCQRAWTTLGGGLQRTMSTLLKADLDRAIDLLAERRLQVVCFGGRFTRLAAEYLDLHLRLIRPGTRFLSWSQQPESGFLADVGPRTVCVAFDVRRYQEDVIALAQLAAERGAKVILVTDPWMSPISAVAEVVLGAAVESLSSFDSMTSVLAIVDVLVAGLYAQLEPSARQRMEGIEASRDRLLQARPPGE
ncbi:MAG: MurR/RpiR family transcriptional regulator [Acidobacteriota bacterium]|nr:MurR/RpiR family transcriptional regulator [Acidobacteriota bacterium]MDE3082625.1 MurR/RpiR family transcriptional regulator [Acidobacteriota bacterium]